jgi:twitching motility protein PilT
MVMPGAVAEPSSGEPATPELQAAHEIPTTEAEASTKTPIAEELPAAAETEQEAALAGSTTSDSVPGEHERVEVEQEEPGVIGPVAPVVPPVDERMVAAGVASAHLPDTVIPETAAAASVLPPAPIAEPRIPVSETLPELHGHGAHAPGSYQDSQSGPADTRHGVVVPLGRSAARADAGGVTATLHSALRTAGARGASTVYLVAQSKPVIRVNGEIVVLENEPVLTAADVQGLVTELAPPQRQPDQGEAVEWMSDVPDVGRVRCLTFRDHRGPGVIFRMDHVGLPAEVRALCSQPDGLVVIAGPHASGKSTLLNSFVDQINVTRGDHVIALESHIGFVHESRRSFISQRELSDDAAQAAATARAALREDPDVMVIEDLRSADLTAVALEAAESGRLVFVSVSAPSAVMAIQQLLESFPADRRARAARSLSNALRGVVTQVLVRRARGGRAPAREVLLNTPTVASMIRDGRTGDLPSAFESGRGQGMVSMTDALMGLVREGAVQPAEAYRKASDRSTLLGRLKQEGVDTAFADRLV